MRRYLRLQIGGRCRVGDVAAVLLDPVPNGQHEDSRHGPHNQDAGLLRIERLRQVGFELLAFPLQFRSPVFLEWPEFSQCAEHEAAQRCHCDSCVEFQQPAQ